MTRLAPIRAPRIYCAIKYDQPDPPFDQLIAAVRQEVPSFDGTTAPANESAVAFLVRAMQKVLSARGIPGRVEFTPQADMKTGRQAHMFGVKDPSPKVCALSVSGASALPERDLLEPLRGVIGGDYSRFFFTTASAGTLLDMYHRRGHWRAAFAAPTVALDVCPGVTVTLHVTEGPAFAWDRAEWNGNSALSAAALDQALWMRGGETADASKIDTGVRQIHAAYGKQGYILQTATFEPRLDDATRRAVFQFTVGEGPQFRMGTLAFALLVRPEIGFPDAITLSR